MVFRRFGRPQPSQRGTTVLLTPASVLIVAIGLTLGVLGLMWGSKIKTLSTLRKVEGFPLYVMKYSGDYGFDAFVEHGAQNDDELLDYVTKRLVVASRSVTPPQTPFACTAFLANDPNGNRIFGRNFDFEYSPALLLYTHPTKGYASVSMVSLSWLGYSKDKLPDSLSRRLKLLAAPYVPTDGINECGLGAAFLSVPTAQPPSDPEKTTLNTTTSIRLVLDHARTVDEAITLLSKHNVYFSRGVQCHYFLCDASGQSAVIEYVDGKMEVTRKSASYQVVTNFVVSSPTKEGDGQDRYTRVATALEGNAGVISAEGAMSLLSDVKIPDRTLWSLVYNLSRGSFQVAMGGRYDRVRQYSLKMR